MKVAWVLDLAQTYQLFEFSRQRANGEPYTMIHYTLHFKRCDPSLDASMDLEIPAIVAQEYTLGVEQLFKTEAKNVDLIKQPIELELKAQLQALGIQV